MDRVSSSRSYRSLTLPYVPIPFGFSLSLYALVLFTFVSPACSLWYNPVSMTDGNKAKEYGVGVAALACATVSLIASIVCMYWFCRFAGRFRHRLIMILIYGDLMRGAWLFVFATISLARGTVKTGSTFCQVSGFLVQYGTQTSDYAVLVMAVHSAIQVFNPSTRVSSDGLYPCRRYIYVGAFVLPVLMAGLAFSNPRQAYVSQGAFCTLPVRPFWYRLALTWVPRYIIVITIIGLAVAIYAHVGFKFRGYSNVDTGFEGLKTYDGLNSTPHDTQNEAKMDDITFELHDTQSRPQPQRRKSSIGHDIFTAQRQSSSALALSPTSSHVPQRVSFESGIAQSPPTTSFHLARSRPFLLAIPSGHSINNTISPYDGTSRSNGRTTNDNSNSSSEPTTLTPSSKSLRTLSPTSPAQVRLERQRQRIHRQLRLIFIYPLVYTLMWLIPFAMHCMNYWNKYVDQPVEFLRIGSSMCICMMGAVDALIFSVREKPWRGMPRSDGTFWGSFAVRRRQSDVGDALSDGVGGSSAASARRRGSHSYRSSASGDFARIAAEQARQRLDLEREERLRALGERPVRDVYALDFYEGGKRGGKRDSVQLGMLNVGDGSDGKVYDDTGLEDDTVETVQGRRKK
ncbi:G protein-coupled glucose receptor regulating Gpa2-domain-containing protein [Boeremia exigua]|uniref:G protein-coupled glucose receptor regulating Gpa2-domain-containing protein n=1 Tax=Boeremia exigua TaxID=749465 RepID=UPI001E8D16AE|nr:G protein-coupled glucose receptor regulating Gpa2-domain-containing protein [Boeremia exigua]KAH6614204.1 G protein-coupled glucose receptor regulating Gpa2-domain-containing protein [Boeremia exigua]